MKIIQFSREYQPAIHAYFMDRGVPSLIVNNRINWVDTPGVAKATIKFVRFTISQRPITIDLVRMCQVLDIPFEHIREKSKDIAFTIDPMYLPMIVDYCEQMQVDYDSLLDRIGLEEGAEIPITVDKTHVSVRSLKPGKMYDIVYTPKLVKFLRDPSYGTWMYISDQYKEAVDIAADLLYMNREFLHRHIKWITDEEDVFDVAQVSRVALYQDNKYKYINLLRFRRIALGEEPVDFEELAE